WRKFVPADDGRAVSDGRSRLGEGLFLGVELDLARQLLLPGPLDRARACGPLASAGACARGRAPADRRGGRLPGGAVCRLGWRARIRLDRAPSPNRRRLAPCGRTRVVPGARTDRAPWCRRGRAGPPATDVDGHV